ncbi:MAG: HDOD domain-containing protein [Planctomycetes bacterium]|nr:HDOD domain-containing protein [Planctomycetota bacterium]
MSIFVGRQPIFDRRLDVVAYELLYRSCDENRADFSDGNRATATVLSNAFMELGPDVVTAGKPAWVNLTRDVILDEFIHLFPPDRVVAEILEGMTVDDQLIQQVRSLKDAGYRIVLDDFVFDEEFRPLLELADVVKLDVMQLSRDEVREHLSILEAYSVLCLAEKIETHEDFEFCRAEGFALFQGYFLSKPQIVKSERPPDSRLALFELLAQINDPQLSMEQLESTIERDVGLSYKLLRYINSAAFALPVKVESIRHALMMLGRRLVQAWVNLVVLTGLIGRSNELLTIAMVRARMCDQIARRAHLEKPEAFFTAGLFSTLDAIMGRPMAELLIRLPLSDELQEALTDHGGRLGEILRCVVAYEEARWNEVAVTGVARDQITASWFESLEWVSQVLSLD